MSSKDEGAAVAPQNRGSWSSFLKSITSFNGDLSSLTAPPFILSSTSLTEYSGYWAEHPSIFVAPARESDPEKRALLVLKWFLSTLKQQYASRSDKLGSEKKPLNPFLGELFLGHWDGDEETGTTRLVSEQVSHHPPCTAYCIWNDKHKIQLQGYNAQKASFSRTINVKQIGHAVLTLTPPGSTEQETYLITLPSLHIESLIYGTPFVELDSRTSIASSTGYVAKIDYSGKGWLSGKKNTFTASLWKPGSSDEKHPLYTVDGQWNDKFSIKEASSKKQVDSHDAKNTSTTALTVAPLSEQDVYESRRAWGDVAKGIERGDMDAVSAAKSKIENAQRQLRKEEKEQNREWERRFFTRVDESSEKQLAELGRAIGVVGSSSSTGFEADKTGGIWRFKGEEVKTAKPPYHKEGGRGLGLKQ